MLVQVFCELYWKYTYQVPWCDIRETGHDARIDVCRFLNISNQSKSSIIFVSPPHPRWYKSHVMTGICWIHKTLFVSVRSLILPSHQSILFFALILFRTCSHLNGPVGKPHSISFNLAHPHAKTFQRQKSISLSMLELNLQAIMEYLDRTQAREAPLNSSKSEKEFYKTINCKFEMTL